MIRINKYIAKCGICSRRKADELIVNGKVSINGNVNTNLGFMIDENKDIVKIDNKEIKVEEDKVYIMLNKPKGYVTTNNEQFGRSSILDLVHENVRVYPIGRLDMYTEGLLLLTNDGEFANRLMHPKNKIQKVYIAKVNKEVTDRQLDILRNGVDIGGYVTKAAIIDIMGKNILKVIISEGKNRQVRRMFESVGLKVLDLKRIQIGNLKLKDLPLGKYRYLSENEIKNI